MPTAKNLSHDRTSAGDAPSKPVPPSPSSASQRCCFATSRSRATSGAGPIGLKGDAQTQRAAEQLAELLVAGAHVVGHDRPAGPSGASSLQHLGDLVGS